MTSLRLDPIKNTATFFGFNSASIGLGNVSQFSDGKILLNADTKVEGLLSVFPKFEVRNNSVNVFLYPWNETNKLSARIDILTQEPAKEYEVSVFRDTFCTNTKAGLAIYRTNLANAINTYFSAFGTSYINSEGGWLGVGTKDPLDRLHVSNGFIRCGSGLRLGANSNSVTYASAAPTTGTWLRGDVVHNTVPSAGGFAGWICTVAGTPGTWKTWGAISA